MPMLPREDRIRVAIAVVAGVVTAVVVVALWILKGGAAAHPDFREALTAGDTAAERAAGERTAKATTGPIIGAFQSRVEARLRADDPEVRPILGPVAIRARRIRWLEPGGGTFAEAPSATGELDLGAARAGDILVSNVVVNDARVTLREDPVEWNYEVVLAELLDGDGDDDGRDRRVVVRDLSLANAHVDVIRPGQRFSISDLQATVPAIWFADPAHADPALQIARAAGTLSLGDTLPVAIVAEDALVRLPEGVVAFEVARLNLDGTQLAGVEGTWNPEWSFPGLNARGRALDVRFADLARFAPERLPEEGTATFAWEIEPLEAERVEIRLTDLTAVTEGSSVAGAVAVRLGGTGALALQSADLRLDPVQVALIERFAGPLPYAGRLTGTVRGTGGDIDFDVMAALHPDAAVADSFTTALRGSIAMSADGFTLRRVQADLRAVPLASLSAFMPGLPLRGYVSGTVSLAGMPDRAPLDVDVRLELADGVLTAAGTVDLTGPTPVYDLAGRIIGLQLPEVLRPRAPPVALTGSFSLAGQGISPESADARIRVDGDFTGWETSPGDALHLAATVRNGALQVETLGATIATLSITGDGQWRFVDPQSGAIRYALLFSSLEAWGPYLPGPLAGEASGRFAASGTLSGPLSGPRLEGRVEGATLAAAGWTFQQAELTYELVLGDSLPQFVVTGSGTGIESPTAGSFATATLDARLVRPDFQVTLRADRTVGGVVQVVADGVVPLEGDRTLVLRQLDADVEGGRWTLLRPATFTLGDSARLAVDDFEMTEAASEGRVLVQGVVWPIALADVRVEADALPLGDLQALLGIPPQVAGDLHGVAEIHVAAGTPTVDATFRLDSGAIRGVVLSSLEGELHFADGYIDARAVATLDTAGALTLALRVPAEVSVDSPNFRLLPEGEVTGTLETTDLALAPLVGLNPMFRDIEGRANGRVTLAGTVQEPDLAGELLVVDGAVTVLPLAKRFTQIGADLALEGRRVIVRGLRVYAEGRATVRGEIVLEELTDPVAQLTAELEAFRPAGVPDREDAAFTGALTLSGPLRGPTVSGSIAVNDGYIPIPAFGGPLDDFSDLPAIGDAGAQESWMDALRVNNLVVQIENDVWFIGEGAQAQLGGQITVDKPGDSFIVQGTLEGERGTYTLQAGPIVRRFAIANAQVRFLGTPEINPAIDITARRAVLDPQGRQLDIDVRITGTMRTPRLTLASADLATVPESELLSFLFFGQGSANFGTGGNAGELLLDQTVFGGLSELAGLELERALVEELGLSFDIFQLRFGGPGGIGGFGSPTVVLGWELGSEFFLTVEGALAALTGGSANTRESLWAIRLEWAFDRNSRARFGYEPVARNRYLRGFSLGLSPLQPKNQFVLELRRRWTY